MSPVFRHGRLRLYLLKLLDESPRHGYEVIRLLQDRFMGVYAPSPGTIYPRLARLEEEGLVTHDEADGRKVYRITDKGREELRNRSDDLSELEDEITASVRDIAREVTEDVRETVRNLREELTFAARDMHRRGAAPPALRPPPRPRPPPPRPAPPARPGPAAPQRRPAAPPRPRRRLRVGRGPAGRSQQQDAGSRTPGMRKHSTGTPGATRLSAEHAGAGRDEAGQAHGARPGWRAWPPGGSGWADPGTYRDLEQLARRFTRELRAAAAQAQAVSEDAVGDLRTILDDALDRIKAEVFGTADASGPDDAPRPGTRPGHPPRGRRPRDRTDHRGPRHGTTTTGSRR